MRRSTCIIQINNEFSIKIICYTYIILKDYEAAVDQKYYICNLGNVGGIVKILFGAFQTHTSIVFIKPPDC